MSFRRLLHSRSIRYTLATGAAVGALATVGLNQRLALDFHDSKEEDNGYYQGRSTSALLSSLFVYTISSSPTLVAIGKASISACDAIRTPWLYTAVAGKTFYTQFCGGETCAQVEDTIRQLRQDKMGVILAYAKEESNATEAAFERVKQDTLETICVASYMPHNFVAIKLTALADPSAMKAHTTYLRASTTAEQEACQLSYAQQQQIDNLRSRLKAILEYSVDNKVKVLIDAEQDRYQGTIEALTLEAFRRYNKKEAYVYATYQCYLKRTLANLQQELTMAKKEGWVLGAKLVRGAYIASDPRHLIHDTKSDTDAAYNSAIRLLMSTKRTETIVASHNEESLDLALSLFPPAGPVAFSQLYGMGAPVTHALLQKLKSMPEAESTRQGGGIRVYSYVPWGTIEESMKYLLRRADENSAMVARGKAERNQIVTELVHRFMDFAKLT